MRVALQLAVLCLAACALACLGCSQHLLGTRDVELDYDVTLDAAPHGRSSSLEAARQGVLSRLAAAHISADVEAVPPSALRVTVDEASAEVVDEYLEWRGGLAIYRLDPDYTFSPTKLDGLTAKTEVVDGRVERYFAGDVDSVLRAARATAVDPGHRIVVDVDSGHLVRTRAVALPALVDLTGGIARVDAHGKSLSLVVGPQAIPQFSQVAAGVSEAVAVVRDRSIVAIEPLAPNIAADGLVVPLGDDLAAYTRVQRLKRILESPTLPHLARTDVARRPANWALAVTCLLLPVLLSFGWLFFVRRFDRARPEPLWLVLATFVLGGLSALLAGLVEWALDSLSPYLNPTLMTLGGQLRAAPIAVLVFTVSVGLPEEGAKLLGAWSFAGRRREFDEPIDGIVYAAASALGFAAVENVSYFAEGRLGGSVVVSRAFMTVPAHVLFSAIWGYALGRKLVEPRTRVPLYLLLASLAHGAFDAFLGIDGLGYAAVFLNLGLASLFVVMLRRSLRHGVVTPEAAGVAPASRALFPVGSRALFALFAVAMHVVAGLLFALGIYAQTREWRVGFLFAFVSSALVGVFALMAYGLSEAMPLDVVVDDYGVTFGGAAVPWGDVRAYETRRFSAVGQRAEIRLRTREGAMTLGPADVPTIDRLVRAIAERVTARPPPPPR